MLTVYFFVLVLCLLNCSSCASGSEELSDADLLLLKNLWNNQLESDAQREEANSHEANSHLNGVLWKEAGHGRCPRWVADNPILVRYLDAVEYTVNPEPGLLRVVHPENIALSTIPATNETAHSSSEPGSTIPEMSDKEECSDKVATLPPSDISEDLKANKNQTSIHYMAFLLLGPYDDIFSTELLKYVSEVAGAFPHVYFVVGNGARFSTLAFSYTMRGFPSLLLFKDGVLHSRFREDESSAFSTHSSGILSRLIYKSFSKNKYGPVTSYEVAAWIAKNTNQLPRAFAKNVSICDKQLNYIYGGLNGMDSLLWLSGIFVALRILMWVQNSKPT